MALVTGEEHKLEHTNALKEQLPRPTISTIATDQYSLKTNRSTDCAKQKNGFSEPFLALRENHISGNREGLSQHSSTDNFDIKTKHTSYC